MKRQFFVEQQNRVGLVSLKKGVTIVEIEEMSCKHYFNTVYSQY